MSLHKCSECGAIWEIVIHDCPDHALHEKGYCPGCGADLDEQEEREPSVLVIPYKQCADHGMFEPSGETKHYLTENGTLVTVTTDEAPDEETLEGIFGEPEERKAPRCPKCKGEVDYDPWVSPPAYFCKKCDEWCLFGEREPPVVEAARRETQSEDCMLPMKDRRY